MEETILEHVNTLSLYYEYLDNHCTDSQITHKLLTTIQKTPENLSGDDNKKIKYELMALEVDINKDNLVPFLSLQDQNGNLILCPDFSSFDEDFLEYLKLRISGSNNTFIKAHFSHILWLTTKKIEYAEISIDNYFQLIDEIEIQSQKDLDNHWPVKLTYIFKKLSHLSLKLQKSTTQLLELAKHLAIYKNEQDEKEEFVVKCNVIKFLIKQCQNKKYNIFVLNGLGEICSSMADKDNGYCFTIDFLDMGEAIARLQNKDEKCWWLKRAEYFEKLMNKEEKNSFIAPQYCQTAIGIYKKLTMNDKVDELMNKYEVLKDSMQLSEYRSDAIDLSFYIKEYEDLADNLNSEKIINFLMMNSSLIPNYNDMKKLTEETMQSYTLLEFAKITLNKLNQDKIYKREYVDFVDSMSYAKADEVITFEKAIESFKKVVKFIEVNAKPQNIN